MCWNIDVQVDIKFGFVYLIYFAGDLKSENKF